MAEFRPHLATTGIGSLPHLSPAQAVADVLAFCPDYPYWPQLPRLGPREGMYRQYSEGLPGIVADGMAEPGAAPTWRRDEAALERLERVYADVLNGDEALEDWAVAPADARGLRAFAEALTGAPGRPAPRPVAVKGQITGPVSLGLAVTGEGGRALLYEEDLMDGVARGLALRARWQQRYLDEAAGATARPEAARAAGTACAACAARVLISVDEPYLGTFGSAYFPYRPETVLGYLRVFDEALGARGALWGVHCCANTDWEFVLGSPVRFVSFDAYAYGDRLALYPEAVRAFLAAGKSLLWGIVPTAADVLATEDAPGLARRLQDHFGRLVARGVPEGRLVSQSMVTPACGLAGLDVDGARRAMSLARAVSEELLPAFPRREGDAGERD